MSEGGFELGAAYVSVTPEIANFAQMLDEELGGLSVAVKVVPQMGDFAAQVDEELGGVTATVTVDADTGPAREQVGELVDSGLPKDATFTVSADTAPAEGGLRDLGATADETGAQLGKLTAGAEAAAGALGSLGAEGGAAGELSATAEEVRAFGQEFAAVDDEIRQFEATARGTAPALDALKASFASLGRDFDTIHTSGSLAGAELIALRAQLGQVTSELDTMEGAFGTAASAMSEMSGEARSTAEGLDMIGGAGGSAAGGVTDLANAARSAVGPIDVLNGDLAAGGSRDLAGGYAQVADGIGQVGEKAAGSAGQAGELGSRLEAMSGDVEALVGEMNDLRDTEGFAGILSAMPELQQLDDRILALRDDMGSLAQPGAASAEALAEMESRVSATGEAMSAVESIFPTFTGDIENFSQAAAAGAEANSAAQESFTALNMGAREASGGLADVAAGAGSAGMAASGMAGMYGPLNLAMMGVFGAAMLLPPAIRAVSQAIQDNAGSSGVLVDSLHAQYGAVGDNLSGYQAYAQAMDTGGAATQRLGQELTIAQPAVARFGTSAADMGQVTAGVAQAQSEAAAQASNLAGNLGTLESQFGITQTQAEGLAQASGASAQALAQGGGAAEAAMQRIQAFGEANDGARGKVDEMSGDMLTFGNDALTIKSRLSALDDSYNLMVGNFTTGQSAMITAKQGLLGLEQAAKATGASMSGTNQQSLALQQSFYGQIQTDGQTADAMVKAGDSTKTVTGFFNDQIDALTKLAGHNKDARQALYDFRQEEINAELATKGLTDKAKQASQTLADQFIVELKDAGVKAGTSKNDVNNLATAIENTGTRSNATHAARLQMIHDLEDSGMKASKARSLVDYYAKSFGLIPKDVLTHIRVVGSGYWSVQQGGIYPTPGGGNTTAPIGSAPTPPMPKSAAGMLVTGGTPGRDSVPIMAMPGELVVPTRMVRGGAVDHLRGSIPGFGGGGVVGSYSGPLGGMGPWAGGQWNATQQAIIQAVEQAMSGQISVDVAAAKASQASSHNGITVIQNYNGTQYPSPEQKQAMMLSLQAAIGTA